VTPKARETNCSGATVYVGLDRDRKTVLVKDRISLPSSVKQKEVKRMISWINAKFIFIHKTLTFYEQYFGIKEMDEVMLSPSASVIFEWPYKSRPRLAKHRHAHIALHKDGHQA
jgi:hypothetical protein